MVVNATIPVARNGYFKLYLMLNGNLICTSILTLRIYLAERVWG